MNKIRFIIILLAACFVKKRIFAQQNLMTIENRAFKLNCKQYGIAGLWKVNDTFSTNYIYPGKLLGEVIARYKKDDIIDSAFSGGGVTRFIKNGKEVNKWKSFNDKNDLQINQSFEVNKDAITWTISLLNNSGKDISVEDLAIPFFYNDAEIENSKQIFEERVIEHQFLSGSNSFLFWERPSGIGPYLVMVPLAGTSMEYFKREPYKGSEPVYQAFIHSAYTGNKQSGSWRQPFTSALISSKNKKTYSFKFRWAKDYNVIRNILVEEGLIDVHIAPGMTVPNNLDATIALHSHRTIHSIQPEFPQETIVTKLPPKQRSTNLYKVAFSHLGENKITIDYGNNYRTYLEFFVTEPLQTLYKKRAAFIVNHQQHTDITKWYNCLFSVWDMKDSILRGPDNDDGFNKSRLKYLFASDDPALCKAPFVAAKNVIYPNQEEIDAVEYYIKYFVWGGLQRTDKETNPYGVYGTPNWLVNRDSAKRAANLNDTNATKMHIWRSYDYPHIIMMYHEMYKVASLYPNMVHYLGKKEYLIRAKETAKAYFTYPYKILPWYETYKWGCYNELLIPNLIEDLKKEGYNADADWLTKEWEKKVKYFIYDDAYPFRSEYAVDATAYESTEAFGKYALQHKMQTDSLLWYDKNLNKWYSHPEVTKEAALRFMRAQMQANIASRGWLEPAYYYMGSDFRGRSDSYLLSYMAQMGGWAVLDYGLNYTNNPADYIQLGYASYLSSFALMNTGTPKSNYGYWYGGKENDGATGWAYEPQQNAMTWIQKPQSRGAWYYDGEIDLGFGGAIRTAATVITSDPIFGLMAYGGTLSPHGNELKVIPKDGLQQKLYYRVADKKIDIELNRDGFADGESICLNPLYDYLQFCLVNRTKNVHETTLTIRGLQGKYKLEVNGRNASVFSASIKEMTIKIPVTANDKKLLILIKKYNKF
jgi:hypothetical protein